MGYERLIERIGGRPVIIDECISIYAKGIENAFTKAGVVWRRFPDRTPDEKIESGMADDEVLVTRDFALCRRIGNRAILMPMHNGHHKRKVKLAYTWREQLQRMEKSGELDFRIKRGMRMLFTKKTKDARGYTVRIGI